MQNLTDQLNVILDIFAKYSKASQHDDLSDLPMSDRQNLVTRAISAIHRISGLRSTYSMEVERILKQSPHIHIHTGNIIGIVQALRDDLQDGYKDTLIELVHAEIFADFLEMAQYLLEAGYKDAAAVIAGSTLESHIKELSHKHNISTENNGKSIKVDSLNSELVKLEVYSKLDQKNVTAWMGLRNDAAHGDYSKYTNEQVALLIAGIRDFIGRVTA